MGKKLKNIAVLMTALDTDGQARMLRGMEEYARRHECNLATFVWFTGVFEKDKHNLGELNIAYLPDLNLFDGVIVVNNVLHIESNRHAIEKLIATLTCPVVCIGAKLEGCYSVGTDNYSAMRRLVEHFVVDHGMRQLHFVKGVEGNSDAEARFRAYTDVLKEHGIPCIDGRISKGDFYVTGAEKAAMEILTSTLPFPEAIICANDVMAITICDIMQKRGYRVPEDVAVSGYDYTMEGQQHFPALTTVRCRFDLQGREAVKILLRALEGEVVPEEILLEDEVMLGESCGCHDYSKESGSGLRGTRGKDVYQRMLIHQMIEVDKSIMEGDRYENWLDAVRSFIAKVEPKEFYCCVNENFEQATFEQGLVEQEAMSTEQRLAYTEWVKVPIAYRDGRFVEKEMFPSCYAFDEMFQEGMHGKSYIFSPVHYLEHNFGYFVFADSDFPVCNPLYISWLIRMGDAIENIRKQRLLQNAMERLDEMYIRDSLTGVYNRFGMERLFEMRKKCCVAEKRKMFIAFVDLDGLKQINDYSGHAEGDKVIREAAQLLANANEEFGVVRYGGDEFVVIGVADEAGVERYWDNVHRAIEQYNGVAEHKAKMSFSHGHELFPVTKDTVFADYIGMADQKMYERKQEKKATQRQG